MTYGFLEQHHPPANGSTHDSEAGGGPWASQFPALVAFLAAIRWSNGEPRTPGTLSLFTDAATWKACLSDKSSQRLAFVSASNPLELFQRCEEGLLTGNLDWRAQRQSNRPRKGGF